MITHIVSANRGPISVTISGRFGGVALELDSHRYLLGPARTSSSAGQDTGDMLGKCPTLIVRAGMRRGRMPRPGFVSNVGLVLHLGRQKGKSWGMWAELWD